MDGEDLIRYFERFIAGNEFYNWIGLRPVTVESGRVVGELPFERRLGTPSPPGLGSFHGGVVATLVDVTAIGAVISMVSEPMETTISTTELDVEFRESVRETVRAEANVTEMADNRAVVTVEVVRAEQPNSDPVATGEVVCRLTTADT